MQEIRAVRRAGCHCGPLSLLKLEDFYLLGDWDLLSSGCRTAFQVAATQEKSEGCWLPRHCCLVTNGDKALRGGSETCHLSPFSLQIAVSHLESESLSAGARSSQSNFPSSDRKSQATTRNVPETESSLLRKAGRLTSLFSSFFF